jgi:hypothetical protein
MVVSLRFAYREQQLNTIWEIEQFEAILQVTTELIAADTKVVKLLNLEWPVLSA